VVFAILPSTAKFVDWTQRRPYVGAGSNSEKRTVLHKRVGWSNRTTTATRHFSSAAATLPWGASSAHAERARHAPPPLCARLARCLGGARGSGFPPPARPLTDVTARGPRGRAPPDRPTALAPATAARRRHTEAAKTVAPRPPPPGGAPLPNVRPHIEWVRSRRAGAAGRLGQGATAAQAVPRGPGRPNGGAVEGEQLRPRQHVRRRRGHDRRDVSQ